MRIGIITGKDDEISLNKDINKLVPKKYYENGNVHTDIALAFLMKEKFVGFQVDIITPKELTNQRLKKNDITPILGQEFYYREDRHNRDHDRSENRHTTILIILGQLM